MPFTHLAEDVSSYIAAEHLPRNSKLLEPRTMTQSQIVKFFQHIAERERIYSNAEVFRFKAIKVGRKGNDIRSAGDAYESYMAGNLNIQAPDASHRDAGEDIDRDYTPPAASDARKDSDGDYTPPTASDAEDDIGRDYTPTLASPHHPNTQRDPTGSSRDQPRPVPPAELAQEDVEDSL